jgi:hypothetical protein
MPHRHDLERNFIFRAAQASRIGAENARIAKQYFRGRYTASERKPAEIAP